MSRGRTSRRRKNKTEPNKVEDEVVRKNILFMKWLKEKFSYKTTNLRISQCGNGGGNGVFTRKTILKGDAIISIPRRLMIGVREVIFHSKIITSILAYLRKQEDNDRYLTAVQILSLFLIEEKRKLQQQQVESFGPYISMLPQSFTHILYWSNEELNCLYPPHLSRRAANIRNKVTNQFNHLNDILLNMRSSLKFDDVTCKFDDVTWNEYIWAWCCVNTRCVFSDHQSTTKLIDGIKPTNEDNYYLIPFLDMLNHHPQSDVEAKYNHKIEEFQLITNSICHKYNQLFIKYGEHSSLDLLLEYGFVPICCHENLNDSVQVDFDELCTFFKVDDPSKKCLLFEVLIERKLNDDLSLIIHQGPSWSLLVCCILLTNHRHDNELSPRQLLSLICSGKKFQNNLTIMKENLSQLTMEKLREVRIFIHKCEDNKKNIPTQILCRYYQIIEFILQQTYQLLLDNSYQLF